MAMKFKLKPAVVDAIHNTGDDAFFEMLEKFDDSILVGPGRMLVIRSSFGDLTVPVGWWVIRMSCGGYWSCDHSSFLTMFEKI